MQTALLQYNSEGDTSLIKEFLLSLPIFNQIHYFLDNDMFYQFLQFVDVHPVLSSEPFELKPTSTYLFLSPGMLIQNRQRRQNFQKLTKLSRTVKLTQIYLQKDNLNQQNPPQTPPLRTVQPHQLFNQPLLYHINYVGQKLYFVSQHKKSTIVEINLSKMSDQIVNRLRQKHNQKLKFISSLNLFQTVQKYIIENNLNKFQILKVYFDEYLMRQPNLRTNHLFFVSTGEAEVFVQKEEGKKSYLTKAPVILGFDRMKSVKSVTQFCLCYYIQKTEAIQILRKNIQSKYKTTQNQYYLNKLTESTAMDISQSELFSSSFINSARFSQPSQKKTKDERNPIVPASPEQTLSNQSLMMKSNPNLFHNLTSRIPQNKIHRLRQHFPGFINGSLSLLDAKRRNNHTNSQTDNSVLYEIKSLHPKSPQMDSINKMLKMQRLNKIQKCKQNIIQTKQHSLDAVNIRIYQQFEDTKLINKIRKKIQQDIIKKKKVNKNWRSNLHSGVAFNKISDSNITSLH